MKLLRFSAYLMLCVQTLGLVSCSPDSAQKNPDFKVADSFSIKNLQGDLTPMENRQGERQSLTSQLILTAQQRPIESREDIQLKIYSECNSGTEIKSNTSTTTLKSSFPVFELVSPELWLQLPSENKIWNCNFKFTASDSKNNQHIFDITKVVVKNTAEGLFSVLRKDGVRLDVKPTIPLVIKESELQEYTVVYDETGTEDMELVCSKIRMPLLAKNSDFQTLDLLNRDSLKSNFLSENPLQTCRVAIKKLGRIVGISPLMHILFDQKIIGGQVSLSQNPLSIYTYFVKPKSPVNFAIAEMTLNNTTGFKAQYIVDLSSLTEARISYVSESRKVRSSWIPQTLKPKLMSLSSGSKILEQKPNWWRVELLSGHSFKLQIETAVRHNCLDLRTEFFIEAGGIVSNLSPVHIHQVISIEPSTHVTINSLTANFAPFFLNKNSRKFTEAHKNALMDESIQKVNACK